MRTPTLFTVVCFSLVACGAPDRGIDITQEKGAILGCYYNDETASSIRIDENEIFFNDRRIYDQYDYGITGRRNLPTILAWPGTVFRYNVNKDISLKTEPYGDGIGPINFSFLAGSNLRILRIATFPDGTILDFVRSPCQP
jgi:hypothetical protein